MSESGTFYVLVCRKCSPLLPQPFSSASERGKWASEHTRGTGHDSWIVKDNVPAGWRPESAEPVTIDRAELDALLGVATLYVDAFDEDEMMTLPEKLRLQEVEAIIEKHGRRY